MGRREDATTVSVLMPANQEESSSEEEEEDVVSALDRQNLSTSTEPERGRSGRSVQESKESQAQVEGSSQIVDTPKKGKATKAKQEYMPYNAAKHKIWAVPVSLVSYRFVGRLTRVAVPTMREPSRWLLWPRVPHRWYFGALEEMPQVLRQSQGLRRRFVECRF
jgi:hypothetical protein